MFTHLPVYENRPNVSNGVLKALFPRGRAEKISCQPFKARKRRCLALRATEPGEGEHLAAEFSRFVSVSGASEPLRYRRPTPMIPPHLAVQSICSALQMNDWPEEDAGVQTAYLFTKPYQCEKLIAGQGTPERARSWGAQEEWLQSRDFSQMLHAKPFNVLLNCQNWEASSKVVFPSQRMSNKAMQAVKVDGGHGRSQPYTFTFCMERVDLGPYKGCWLVVGLREGDYCSVL